MAFTNPSSQPKLVMLIEPENMFRFRYESELNKKSNDGTSNDGIISHGGIIGKGKTKDDKKGKLYPTVKLLNYNGKKQVQIRVSLYTLQDEKHVLEIRGRNAENGMCCQDLDDDFTATFKSLIIMTYTQKEIIKILKDQKTEKSESRKKGAKKESKNYEAELKEQAKEIMNSVKLCFEAFTEDNPRDLICPPLFSAPIFNQKNPEKIPLRIHHLSHCAGSSKGGDKVILLCDKVQKDKIKVRFYEDDDDDDDDKVKWEGYAEFNKDVDVHHQVAIIFRTPKFRDDIEKEVNVCLVRDGDKSNPVKFRYISGRDDLLRSPKKRKREINLESTSISLCQSSYPADSTPSPSSSSDYSLENNTGQRLEQKTFNLWNFPLFLNDNQLSQVVNESLYSPSSVAPVNPSFLDNLGDEPYGLGDMDVDVQTGNDISDLVNSIQDSFLRDMLADRENPENSVYPQLVDGGLVPDGVTEEIKNHNDPSICSHSAVLFPPSRNKQDICVDPHEIATAQRGLEISIEKSMSNLTLNDRRETMFLNIIRKCITQDGTLSTTTIKLKEKCLKHLSERDKSSNTLLHKAVYENKNVALVLELSKITKYDIVNLKNNSDKTALHIATEKNDCQNLCLLLKYGGCPNFRDQNGNSCFHIAAEYDYVNCIKEIIKHGYRDVNVFNNEGLTPLHVAVMKGSIECVEYLQKFADVNARDKKSGRAPLHYAVDMMPFLLPILLSNNINLNIQDFAGNTPLYIASVSGDVDSMNQLLEAGADPDIRKYKLNSDEDSEDEEVENVVDNVGGTTVDVATNSEVKKVLQGTVEGRAIQSETPLPVLHPVTEEKLCELLDQGKYKNLAECCGMDQNFMDNVHKINPSPTKAILKLLKKEYPNQFIDHLKLFFEMANLSDALNIIEEQQY